MNIKYRSRDVIINLLLKLGLSSATFSNKNNFTIITFHRILPQKLRNQYPLPILAMTPEELQWTISVLMYSYDCGTVTDMLKKWKNNNKNGRPLLAISFDDGQEDNYRYAIPVLNNLGVKATFFIPVSAVDEGGLLWHDLLGFTVIRLYENTQELGRLSEFLGINLTSCRSRVDAARMAVGKAKLLEQQDRVELINKFTTTAHCPVWAGMLNWKQLGEMIREGHEIGSHSMTHPILTGCSDNELHFEIVESRKTLQAKLGISVDSFCYPNGDFNDRIMKVTEKAGYSCAVSTQWKANRKEGLLFSLGRCDITTAKLLNSRGILTESRLSWRLSGLRRLLEAI